MKTIPDTVLTAAALIVTACVAALSAYLFFAHVGERWTYGAAVGIMVVAWIARRFGSSPRNVVTSIIMAGALLSVALGMKVLEHLGWVAGFDIGARLIGVMIGLILVLLSNAIPKRVTSANALTMFRTIGRAFVIGGLGYALAWLVLPLSIADTVAVIIVLISIVVAVASYIGWRRSRDRTAS